MNKTQKYTTVLIYLLAIIFLFFGFYVVIEAEKTRFWQKTPAIVTGTIIEEYKQTNSVRNQTPVFTVVPKFTYNIKGQAYQSTQYRKWQALKSRFSNQQAALNWSKISGYSTGSKIFAYVNPNNYSDAVILQGAHLTAYIPIMLGIFLILLNITIKSYILKKNNLSQ